MTGTGASLQHGLIFRFDRREGGRAIREAWASTPRSPEEMYQELEDNGYSRSEVERIMTLAESARAGSPELYKPLFGRGAVRGESYWRCLLAVPQGQKEFRIDGRVALRVGQFFAEDPSDSSKWFCFIGQVNLDQEGDPWRGSRQLDFYVLDHNYDDERPPN